MSRFHKFCLYFFIFDFIWQVILIQGIDLLKISVDKDEVEFHLKDYFEHMEILKYSNKGIKKYWKVSALKKETTVICGLNKAPLLTLCHRIATSETYRKAKFELTRENRFLHLCYPQYVKLGNENEKRLLEMVTCPYIKRRNLSPPLKDDELLSQRPGTLFVSGSAATNSVLVFISRLENDEIICEPCGRVTEIDMVALKKIKDVKEIAQQVFQQSVEFDDSHHSEDSQEFVQLDPSERPLYFRDLL